MKVHLKVEGIAPLYKTLRNKKELDVDFRGSTVRDLVNNLGSKYGPGVGKAILDPQGEIDMELRVVVNWENFLPYGERMDAPLNDGDILHLMTVG